MAKYSFRGEDRYLSAVVWITTDFPFLGDKHVFRDCVNYHVDTRDMNEWYVGIWKKDVKALIQRIVNETDHRGD